MLGVECPAGKFSTISGSNEQCESKITACPAGKFKHGPDYHMPSFSAGVARTGDNHQDDQCHSCPSGTYKTGNNAGSCSTKTTVCLPGLRLVHHDTMQDDACDPCPSNHYKAVSSSSLVCSPKREACTPRVDFDEQFIKEDPQNPSRVTDDTVCHVKVRCKQGQFYNFLAGVQSVPHIGSYSKYGGFDECVSCPLHTYRTTESFAADGYHRKQKCDQCDIGKYTLNEASISPYLCQKPNVVTFRSTHRIYYWFNEALKGITQCMRTSISMRDTSNAKGVGAVRTKAFSPLCQYVGPGGHHHPVAGSYTQEYTDGLKLDDLTWNGYPLDIDSGGELLVVDLLPGQTVDTTFADLDANGNDQVLDLGNGDTAPKPPLVLTTEAICGCIDYRNLLPASVCPENVLVHVHHDAVSAQTGTAWILEATDEDVHVTADKDVLHVSEIPFASFSCYEGVDAVANGWQQLHAGVRVAADNEENCANQCNMNAACWSFDYHPQNEAGKQCRFLLNPSTNPITANSIQECATMCTEEVECRGFAQNSGTNQCALYFAEAFGSQTYLTGKGSISTFDAPLYCRRKDRSLGRDVHVRFKINDDWSQIAISDHPPAVPVRDLVEESSMALLRACPKRDLGCSGDKCTRTDVLSTLEDVIKTTKEGQLLKASDAADDTEFINFGCVKSGSGEHKHYEDCVPPDQTTLQDLRSGYFFLTDVSGRPDHFETEQVRGHMTFQWTDFSSCEQAFSLSRQQEQKTKNEGATRTYADAESFTDDVYIHGSRTCTEHIKPERITDQMYSPDTKEDKRAVGLWQRYCVTALAENGASAITYESNAVCQEHQVFWESTVLGRVVAKGHHTPQEGIRMDWKIPGTETLNGTVYTDGDGQYEIHIRDVAMELYNQFLDPLDESRSTLDTVTILVMPSEVGKNSQFICPDGAAICGGYDEVTDEPFPPAVYPFQATYLKFKHGESERLNMMYAPIAPFDGQVYFPLMLHMFEPGDRMTTLGHTLPSEAASEAESLCYIRAAAVQVFDYDVNEILIKEQLTTADGKFHVAVPQHSRVTVKVLWRKHEFVFDGQNLSPALFTKLPTTNPVATMMPSADGLPIDVTVFTVLDPADYRQINMRDTTGEIIRLGAHGSMCRNKIGEQAAFSITVPPSEYACGPSNELNIELPTDIRTYGRVMLPAHLVDITLLALEPNWPEVTDAGELGYFHRLRYARPPHLCCHVHAAASF